MRVCIYTATALPKVGGQELMVDALARELVKRGHTVTVLAPRPRATGTVPDGGYKVVFHPRFVSSRFFVGWYQRFLIRAGPFDVVHCQDAYPTGWVAVLAGRKTGVPVVITSHGGDLNEGNVRIVKPGVLERCREALLGARVLVSIGKFTSASFERVLGHAGAQSKVVEIPNGVDLSDFEGEGTAVPGLAAGGYVLFLGRLHRRKGVDLLIEAVGRVRGLKVAVAGSGDLREELESRAAALGVTGRVVFLGRRGGGEKVWLLKNCRVVVMPSRGWEGFPLVVLEAGAAGRGVVASDVPGLGELVEDGGTGRVVAEGDVDALAGALREAWEDAVLCERWGAAGRRKAEGYDWSVVAGKYEAVYREAAKNV